MTHGYESKDRRVIFLYPFTSNLQNGIRITENIKEATELVNFEEFEKIMTAALKSVDTLEFWPRQK